ncbi:hypothetical protein GCM10011607_35500 [Shewanella inventionis]|uniref:Uncharacterized protein n=1 Tax=Shewanella inventionis TaxID=1738770 RepID=A0ABQ1JP15_9GAMM|nr:hypothetical protein GCM10011607_35500 [Shewanella inventionis]
MNPWVPLYYKQAIPPQDLRPNAKSTNLRPFILAKDRALNPQAPLYYKQAIPPQDLRPNAKSTHLRPFYLGER